MYWFLGVLNYLHPIPEKVELIKIHATALQHFAISNYWHIRFQRSIVLDIKEYFEYKSQGFNVSTFAEQSSGACRCWIVFIFLTTLNWNLQLVRKLRTRFSGKCNKDKWNEQLNSFTLRIVRFRIQFSALIKKRWMKTSGFFFTIRLHLLLIFGSLFWPVRQQLMSKQTKTQTECNIIIMSEWTNPEWLLLSFDHSCCSVLWPTISDIRFRHIELRVSDVHCMWMNGKLNKLFVFYLSLLL